MTETTKIEVPLTLLQRLHAVMQDVSYVQKDKAVSLGSSRGSYKAVTHDAVTAKIRPALVKHGILYYPVDIKRAERQIAEATHKRNAMWRTEVDMVVRFVNVDDGADFIDVQTIGYGCDTGDKGPGKAESYAVKYALLKAFGLETGEDADNEASPEETRPAEPMGKPVPKGPQGGKPKPARNESQIALEWSDNGEARAAVYPFTNWDSISLFLDDLSIAIAGDARAWDTNVNDIDRVREKIVNAPHPQLIDKLQDIELQLEAKFLEAG